ncbi:IS3 family transposase [Saccharopolyspora elongata]
MASVQVACRVLDLSESGYYEWRNRPPSARTLRHAWLTDLIRKIHADSRGTYGARRVHAELTLGHSIAIGHGAVEFLMKHAGIKGLPATSACAPNRRHPSRPPRPVRVAAPTRNSSAPPSRRYCGTTRRCTSLNSRKRQR